MTNEEAIEILQNMAPGCGEKVRYPESMNCEAIEIAINALSLHKKEPLTLEQLQEMDEQPVWVKCLNSKKYTDPPTGWRIVERSIAGTIGVWNGESCFAERDYGRTWQAYAYPPIDRDKWEPCVMCESCTNCWFCMNSNTGKPCADCDKYSKFSPVSYCRYCGRPLTEEAWEELRKRLRG